MRKIIFQQFLIIALVSFPQFSFGQLLKEEVRTLVKLAMFNEALWPHGYVANQETLNDFLLLEFKIDTLQAKGLEEFIFLSISPVFQNPTSISLDRIPIVPENCREYILVITRRGKSVFKLKGFHINEFPYFLMLLKELKYPHLNSHKQFVNNYFVEKLDLSCLYKASKASRLTKDKFGCLSTCSELTTTH